MHFVNVQNQVFCYRLKVIPFVWVGEKKCWMFRKDDVWRMYFMLNGMLPRVGREKCVRINFVGFAFRRCRTSTMYSISVSRSNGASYIYLLKWRAIYQIETSGGWRETFSVRCEVMAFNVVEGILSDFSIPNMLFYRQPFSVLRNLTYYQKKKNEKK